MTHFTPHQTHIGFDLLNQIREEGIYHARNSSKGSMLPELFKMVTQLSLFTPDTVKQFILVQNGLSKNTFYNRQKISYLFRHRYINIAPQWIGSSLHEAARNGIQSPEFLSLAYLYYALTDRVTFDFVTTFLRNKWQIGQTFVGPEDFALYLNQLAENAPEVKLWRETTRNRLGKNTLTALRDFGLLTGKVKKHLQRPPIVPDTVYHLLAILWAEGMRGREILDAPDWRLFLWDEGEIAEALNGLSQRRWIRFERSGNIIILEMIRVPEAGNDRD